MANLFKPVEKKTKEKFFILEIYEDGKCQISDGGFSTNDIIAFLDNIKLQYQLENLKQ